MKPAIKGRVSSNQTNQIYLFRFLALFYPFFFQLNLGKSGNPRLKISLLKLDHIWANRAK